jgi:ABC-type iron transport system FetAB ATPase subunit
MARLAIESLCTFGFGPFDLSIEAGKCAAVAGPSGSGKSLMLRAIADLDPHQGRVLLDGTACTDMPPTTWRSRVRLVPAESAWWATSVGEHFRGIPEGLERLGFDRTALDLPVARMSTGERQRLALLRALEDRPPVLLLDEPTANLDADNSAIVEQLLLEHMRDHGAAVVWITHDIAQAARVADRQWKIENRRLVPRGAA